MPGAAAPNPLDFAYSGTAAAANTTHRIGIDFTRFSSSIYQKAVELELSVIPIAHPINDLTHSYNELECIRLNDLFNATKHIESQLCRPTTEAKTMHDILYALDTKCVEDGRNTVMLRLENIRTNSESVYSRLKEYLKVLKYEMDSDHRVLDLMTAIVLFNPDHDDLVDKETIKMEQKIYMYLLKRYLHLKYSTTCEANGRFLNLLNTFTDLFYLENRVRQNFLSFRANQFHPVINPDFNDTKRHKIDHKVITIDSESAPAIETRNLL
ncbi:unnamed protein product [Medioppia subpectinata]|uniref:NR LBD domain-containing protein n=1 Tax=Medioppia subpectinata TaxID=1979941 RepID=A0A7R9KDY4_9ACAR|nr:unnamed protein product [Medioppia subpectinata]CAG2101551.1 unnamed protein product [Medioppia subpectinata]